MVSALVVCQNPCSRHSHQMDAKVVLHIRCEVVSIVSSLSCVSSFSTRENWFKGTNAAVLQDGNYNENDDAYDKETTIIARIGHEWQRKLWRLRYHLATLVRYVRKQLRLPIGSTLDDQLRWLENATVGKLQ